MPYFGELIAVAVAVAWTITALFMESASRRLGSLVVNVLRMALSFAMVGVLLFATTGSFLPQLADSHTWRWMMLSGLVGFVFGDFCLFHSYTLLSSRFSQLIMTLAPPFAALAGWLMLGETMGLMAAFGMFVTLAGISISIFNRPVNGEKLTLKLPLKGILFALGGALGQGIGIVLSKKGMLFYEASAAGDVAVTEMIPFAATQIRVITGFVGFFAWALLAGRGRQLIAVFTERKALFNTFCGSFFGPFLGVSLSLMAVLYTSAGVASTIMATVPILILVPYRLLYKQRITTLEVLGALISVCGVAMFFL